MRRGLPLTLAAGVVLASPMAIALPIVTICDDDGANCVKVQDATPEPNLDDLPTKVDAWALEQLEDYTEGKFRDEILEEIFGETMAGILGPIIDVFESEETAPRYMDEIDPNNPPQPFSEEQPDQRSKEDEEAEQLDDETSDSPEDDSDAPPLIIEPLVPVPDPTPLASNGDDDDDSIFDD